MNLLAIPAVLSTIIFWATLALKVFAFGDAIMRQKEAFPAADKQTKTFWLIILGLAVVVGVVFPTGISLLNIVGVTVAAVYLVGVRPAIREISGSGRGGRNGRGGPSGPYGRR